MKFGFVIDNRKCIGCHACTVACKAEHDVPIGVNRTWVKYIEKGVYPNTRRAFAVHRCNHCENAPCVLICPVIALYIRADGIVDFDNRRCIGCKACTQACPYNSIYIDPEKQTAAKCNYCAHRIDIGLEPACVNVCPERAIISGNIDDPTAEISQLIARKQVQIRKPEKRTMPKLFYIESDEASITPAATKPESDYIWSEQSRGVGYNVSKPIDINGNGWQIGKKNIKNSIPVNLSLSNDTLSIEARRVYDAPDKGVLWGAGVPWYILTKAIAAGVVFIVFFAYWYGIRGVTAGIQGTSVMLAIFFLILTGIILVVDLNRPERFLYVLFRPNWKSWLVKGAYSISIFGGLMALWFILKFFKWDRFADLLTLPMLIFAVLSAVYTAFLFAQAKGRDFWQSQILPIYMFIHSLMAGAAVWLIMIIFAPLSESFVEFIKVFLSAAIVAHLLLEVIEITVPHSTKDAHMSWEIISKRDFKYIFWGGVILAGNILPLILLMVSASVFQPILLCLSSVLTLLGVYISNHLIVRAPQLIPLS